MSFEINVNLSRLHRIKAQEYPNRARAGMQELVALGQKEVRERTPVDQGIGRGSVVTGIHGTGAAIRGTVSSTQTHMIVLERGRRPGAKPPPTSAIVGWMGRHGIDAKLAFVIARAIGRRGTKPRRMFAQSAEIMRRQMGPIFMRHLRGLGK